MTFMKKALLVFLFIMMALSCVFAENSASMTEPQTLIEKFSYVVGYYAGSYYYYYKYQLYPDMIDEFAFMGDEDYAAKTPLYTEEEMTQILNDYVAEYKAKLAELAKSNLKEAEDFLVANAKNKDVYTTESGLQYKIISKGKGKTPNETNTVELDYELTLLDGTVVDSSYERGEHSSFALTNVIAGFSEGCQLMPIGSHYIFYIHPNLGYGEYSSGPIEPNSLLVFEVETYSIVE